MKNESQSFFTTDAISSIYLSTFNLNGANLTRADAEQWLFKTTATSASARDASFVVLSLQECPTYPDPLKDHECNDIVMSPLIEVLGPPLCNDKKRCDNLRDTIQSMLTNEHVLLADVAMGEEPATSSDNNEHGDTWYGFIRLIVFAKRGKVHFSFFSSVTNIEQLT